MYTLTFKPYFPGNKSFYTVRESLEAASFFLLSFSTGSMREDEVRGGQRSARPQLLLRMDLGSMCSMPAHSPGLHHSIRIQEPRGLGLGAVAGDKTFCWVPQHFKSWVWRWSLPSDGSISSRRVISMLVSEANIGKYCHASLSDGDVFWDAHQQAVLSLWKHQRVLTQI